MDEQQLKVRRQNVAVVLGTALVCLAGFGGVEASGVLSSSPAAVVTAGAPVSAPSSPAGLAVAASSTTTATPASTAAPVVGSTSTAPPLTDAPGGAAPVATSGPTSTPAVSPGTSTATPAATTARPAAAIPATPAAVGTVPAAPPDLTVTITGTTSVYFVDWSAGLVGTSGFVQGSRMNVPIPYTFSLPGSGHATVTAWPGGDGQVSCSIDRHDGQAPVVGSMTYPPPADVDNHTPPVVHPAVCNT